MYNFRNQYLLNEALTSTAFRDGKFFPSSSLKFIFQIRPLNSEASCTFSRDKNVIHIFISFTNYHHNISPLSKRSKIIFISYPVLGSSWSVMPLHLTPAKLPVVGKPIRETVWCTRRINNTHSLLGTVPLYIHICMADIYARRGVFEFMYDVGANNIKLGRDRKMARAREVVLAWKAAVNRQTPPVLGTFLPDFVIRTFPHYYRENREFMYAVFNKMSFM